MDYFYSSQERNKILDSLTEKQHTFLLESLKRGKKTVFSKRDFFWFGPGIRTRNTGMGIY